MSALFRFMKSTILSKVVMAGTGLVLLLFLLGHMVGNLQMYLGQEKMNHYAETLQGLGGALWLVRSVLLLCMVLHVLLSIRLKMLNMAARPVPYEAKSWVKATLSSRTMLWTGSFIGTFLVYHIMHFTVQNTNPGYRTLVDAAGRHDVYTMVIAGYSNPLIALAYIAGMLLLCFHLYHAIASAFQTLGVNHPRYNGTIHGLGILVSLIIAAGFILVPVGVLAGWITAPAGVLP